MKIFSDLSVLFKIMFICVILGFLIGLYAAHVGQSQVETSQVQDLSVMRLASTGALNAVS